MADPKPPAPQNLPAAGANAGACFPAKGVNDPAHPCDPKLQAPPPPPQVAPLITAPLVVVVKKKHTNPVRVPILLRTDKAFTGKGTFTAAPADEILFFPVKKGGTAIKYDGKHNVFTGAALAKGVTLFAEGAKVSTSLNDVVLTLNLSGGAATIVKNPIQVKMTAIDVSLQICKPRVAAGADPPTLSETEKIDPGRAVHVQVASTHLRAILIVGQVKPAGFKGQLELSTVFLGKGSAVLFTDEKSVPAETASNAMDIPVAGKKVFVEGIGISGTIKDIKIKLAVKGLEDDADHVMLTVIEAKLDICASRQRVDKPPDLLSDLDKTAVGRSVAFHAANPKPRAMMILRHIKPIGYVGKLVLTPLATGAGRVQVFENETGGAAIAGLSAAGTPMEIAHDKKFPPAGLHRFAEGSVVSSAMRDISFKLGVKDVEDDCDRVNISVVDVASLQASLKSTWDATKKTEASRPAAGLFNALKADLPFAAPLADLMVVILNSGPITVKAQNIRPAPAKTDLRWEIEQDPTDTVAKGLPALDKDTGDQVVIKPNTPGTFRLVCYCGSNKKHFQNEEIRVLHLVIVKITAQPGGKINGDTTAAVFAPGVNGVATNNAPPPMNLQIDFLVEGGGHDRKFGLDAGQTQVVIGNVGNLGKVGAAANTVDNFIVNYPGVPAPGDPRPGTSAEDPDFKISPAAGFPVPMVDSSRIAQGAVATGGNSPFRWMSKPPTLLGNGPGGKGQLVRLKSFDAPAFGWFGNHPTTGNPWASTQGVNAFTEWVVAYTKTFPRNYMVFGTGGYTVTVIGLNSGGGNWADNGSSNVVTPWSTAGFPKTGDDAGVQVLGPSFVSEVSMINKP